MGVVASLEPKYQPKSSLIWAADPEPTKMIENRHLSFGFNIFCFCVLTELGNRGDIFPEIVLEIKSTLVVSVFGCHSLLDESLYSDRQRLLRFYQCVFIRSLIYGQDGSLFQRGCDNERNLTIMENDTSKQSGGFRYRGDRAIMDGHGYVDWNSFNAEKSGYSYGVLYCSNQSAGDYVISLYGLVAYRSCKKGRSSYIDLRSLRFPYACGEGSVELKRRFPFALDETKLQRNGYPEHTTSALEEFIDRILEKPDSSWQDI